MARVIKGRKKQMHSQEKQNIPEDFLQSAWLTSHQSYQTFHLFG